MAFTTLTIRLDVARRLKAVKAATVVHVDGDFRRVPGLKHHPIPG
jgi:hypothetical protein